MNKKQGIIVTGPEGSGTNLISRILVNVGCDNCAESYGFTTPKDRPILDTTPIVLRRSSPQTGILPPFTKIIETFYENEYDVQVIITIRELHAILSSETRNAEVEFRNTSDSKADKKLKEIQYGYKHIFKMILEYNLPYILVPLESIILYPKETVYYMLDFLELDTSRPFDVSQIYDTNKKWYIN